MARIATRRSLNRGFSGWRIRFAQEPPLSTLLAGSSDDDHAAPYRQGRAHLSRSLRYPAIISDNLYGLSPPKRLPRGDPIGYGHAWGVQVQARGGGS